MEACFLSSRSISGSKDLATLINPRIFSCPKRISSKFPTRKFTSPISISFIKKLSVNSTKFDQSRPPLCLGCYSDSWKPMEDDDDDLFKNKNSAFDETDWRTFRARLVAGQQSETPPVTFTDPSSWVDPDLVTVTDHPKPIKIGNKWAHKIHEPEKGCLLVATEKLDGVHIFERTVILLLSVGPTGPIGIILNRPSLMSIKETKSTVLDVAGTFSDERLFFGGPLEEGLFLVSPRNGGGDCGDGVFREVMKGLYYGTRESVGLAAEMVKRDLVKRSEFRFFDGYCGWEREQLREEILGGYWTAAACSSDVIGLRCDHNHGLWDEIVGLVGPQTGSVI